MYLGIDIGTSAVKAVLVDDASAIIAQASVPLNVSRPRPLWSEQDPHDWWRAATSAAGMLRQQSPRAFAAVRAIGLSGQMHAAVALDKKGRPLRPAILWNDGRAHAQAAALRRDRPDLAAIVGVPAMAGFTGPKLLWLAEHEPHIFKAMHVVLGAKDYVRLKLVNEAITDCSDAAGTWWLDEAARNWSADALAACGLDERRMPALVEGSKPGGVLTRAAAQDWGLTPGIVVAGGAGDAAAGAIGLGAAEPGSSFVSLGTSGQFFVTTEAYRPAPEQMVHAFCHGVPGRWFQMAAMLNGASCLAWAARLFDIAPADLLAETEAAFTGPSALLFLPYLTGERTPHNDPHARGVLFGLEPRAGRAQIGQAVLEGVAFSFADALAALEAAGTPIARPGMAGGGARSAFWARILASVLDRPLVRYRGAETGPAFGAARLARLAATSELVADMCVAPPLQDVILPEPALSEAYRPRLAAFRDLYRVLRPSFQTFA